MSMKRVEELIKRVAEMRNPEITLSTILAMIEVLSELTNILKLQLKEKSELEKKSRGE